MRHLGVGAVVRGIVGVVLAGQVAVAGRGDEVLA